ncbi:MAG: hypothetical protein CBB71_17575 [Rhodopirellula sp. TMED11]|nr:MAG: hypothetical protein CBB71_17575 [Rhodopirellula sp. TMED11]
MPKKHLVLQQSEGIVLQCASRIYAAYVASGRVSDDELETWMKRSIQEAIAMAVCVDDAIISDGEMS